MPSKSAYLTFTQWTKKYNSDILSINVCGTSIVVLSSMRLINELFDKKSMIYSSRPQFTMISDLMGLGFLFSTMPYDDEWRRRRRLFQRYFLASRTSEFQPQQRAYVRRLLPQLIDPKCDFAQSLRHFTGAIAITLAYGIDVKSIDDPYIKVSEHAIDLLNNASAPGKYLVDAIPLLKYVPEWFPGAKFKRDAKEWSKVAMKFREAPFQAAKSNIAKGVAPPSYTATCLDSITASSTRERLAREEEVKDTAAIFYGGGTDTTLSVLLTFMLAMTHFPDAQSKAQEELDRVVGPDRLPDFNDAQNLPYFSALIREVMRWHPTAPVAVPHSSTEDDICDGYFIPKGSIVIPNVWAILQNPETYPNPTYFMPERFLTPSGTLDPKILNPADVVFGFGRRACPGSPMALSTLYIIAACVLHTMRITKPVGSPKWTQVHEFEFTDGLFPFPKPFKCVIKPRSESAERLIRDEAMGTY
ncbi:cytochrome P450 [Macrolepiota fuliginosa MF-IS2]|uniref:Cytochrome P450 n=1 Tax=Macrolepiota fuliginosa MF-IS2 TaxID=1400762 RepID=A0A9P5XAP7_9AGAR|nr:cytochrome P450 [Macrolepiota fuliginosa MF-IS2]